MREESRAGDAPLVDLVGTTIGGCVVTRKIAAGGMGVVYEARQDPPGRTVAVKLLRTALATEEGALRFEREARTLANLRHPGIAQIYGAGSHVAASVERLPYFVLEHVPRARGSVDAGADGSAGGRVGCRAARAAGRDEAGQRRGGQRPAGRAHRHQVDCAPATAVERARLLGRGAPVGRPVVSRCAK